MTLREAMQCLTLLAARERKRSDFEVFDLDNTFYFLVHFQEDGTIRHSFRDIKEVVEQDTMRWTFQRRKDDEK